MATLDRESQQDEILVLKSIYTEEEFSSVEGDDLEHSISGQFDAFIDLPPQFCVTYRDTSCVDNENDVKKIQLSHLPPVSLRFKLPADYPSASPPEFHLSCDWLKLNLMKKLSIELNRLWDQNCGTVILFIWTNFLKEELLQFLSITDSLDIGILYDKPEHDRKEARKYGRLMRSANSGACFPQTDKKPTTITNASIKGGHSVGGTPSATTANVVTGSYREPQAEGSTSRRLQLLVQPTLPLHTLLDYLQRYDEDRARTVFGRLLYSCKICFEEKSGLKCVQFVPCKHIYCRNCIKEYFEVRINDGSVTSMPCPDIKCKSEATQQQIRELVGPTKFNRYDSLLLSAALSTMSDITYCPRLDCQSPVVRESDEKLATCPACNYAFCVFCRMSYHGVEMCRIKNDLKKALINEYNSGDSEVRERLERRYGKRQLVNLVNAAMSEEWISTNSKLCPCCSSPIEKSDGCNKIVCWKCHNYFCWLCSRVLDPSAPYKHFYDPMSKCYNLLFEGVKEALVDGDDMMVFEPLVFRVVGDLDVNGEDVINELIYDGLVVRYGLDNEEDEEDDDDEDDDDVDEEEDDDED